jgi:DNA-binding beta-propeller fold protein YncE
LRKAADLSSPVVRTSSVDRCAFLSAAAGLALAPTSLARPRALALVTADLESHVVVYDVHSGHVVRHLPTVAGPRSIETVAGGTTAIVAHTVEGAISLIDLTTLRVRAVLRDFDEPRYTAAGPDSRYAYVTDARRGEVVTVDLARARVAHRTEVGSHARHLSVDPRSLRLWTALGFNAPAIVTVDLEDPARPRVRTRVDPPFAAHDVVFAPGGAHVWVSSGNERRLAIYAARSRKRLRTLAAGTPPQHIAFTADAAYVTSDDALRVHALDGRLLRETPVPEGSYNVTYGRGRVFTPSLERGTLCVLDRRGRLMADPIVARAAHDVCFADTG